MAAFDENSYSVESFNIRSFKFSELVSALWNPIVQFKLRIVQKFILELGVRR